MPTTAAARQRSVVEAPASYHELVDQYFDFVVGLCRKLGIDPQNCEDVAQHIFWRFYERDILSMFDANHRIEHRGKSYRPRFQSFLSSHVEHYVRGKRERQQVVAAREPLKCDQPVGDGSTSWVEVYGPACEDDYSEIYERELIEEIRQHLSGLPPRSDQDVRDLPRLFEVMLRQSESGKVDSKALAAEFGVSKTAISSWIQELLVQVRVVAENQCSCALSCSAAVEEYGTTTCPRHGA